MSMFSSLWDRLTQNKEASYAFDTDMWEPTANRIYVKRLAVDTCLNFVARTFAQSEFKVMNKDKADKRSPLYYALNVRPNINQVSSEFWHELIYKLLYNGEVLAVQTDTGDLVIADSFVHNKMALYPDTFSGVTIGTYMYQRTFEMKDVLYLTYGNRPLAAYISSLYQDTAELYDRMLEVAMRDKQIRAVINVKSLTGTDEQKQAKLQKYINDIFNSYTKKSIALVPTGSGLDYEEKNPTNESRGTSPVETLGTVKSQFVDDVAQLIGIPPVLLHGQVAETATAKENFMDYCMKPLYDRVETAGNALWFTRAEYRRGNHLNIVGLDSADMTKLAEPLDKLRAGGFVNGDEGRVLLGLDPTGKPEMQEYYVTKNYDKAGSNETAEDDAGTSSTDASADSNKKGGTDNGKDSNQGPDR